MSSFKNPNIPALFASVQYEQDWKKFSIDLLKTINDMSRNLDAILNRGAIFPDNMDCRLISFVSSATPDAENTVAHTLGKTPIGFLVYNINKAAVVYANGTAWTKSNIYLKVNVTSVAVNIIVF